MTKHIAGEPLEQGTKPPKMPPGLVDARELAEILGIMEGWVRQNIRRIPHFKMGRLVRFDPKCVMERFKSTMV